MSLPVERSINVSPPHLQLHTAFSTSSCMPEVVAELPMLVLIFTRKLVPMIIGSDSGCFLLAGITALPSAISLHTNAGVMCVLMPSSSQFIFSRMATYSISCVMTPCLAKYICVSPSLRPSIHDWRSFGRPFSRSISTLGSLYGPLVSYTYTGSLGSTRRSPPSTVMVGVRLTLRIPTLISG